MHHRLIVIIQNIKTNKNDKTNINNNDHHNKSNNKAVKAKVLQALIQNLSNVRKVSLASSNNNMKKKFFKKEIRNILIDLIYRQNYN